MIGGLFQKRPDPGHHCKKGGPVTKGHAPPPPYLVASSSPPLRNPHMSNEDDYSDDEDMMGLPGTNSSHGISSTSLGSTRSSTPTVQGDKKVRKNHNEFEKRRREAQRQRLEELRLAVPGLDPKASMVAVLTGAREYIEELQSRLEGGQAISSFSQQHHKRQQAQHVPQVLVTGPAPYPQHFPVPVHPSTHLSQHQQAASHNPSTSLLPPLVARKISSDSDISGQGLFRKGRAELLDQLPPVSAGLDPESTVFAGQPIQVDPSMFPNQARPSLLTTVIQESFYQSKPRKDSGLLLPTDTPDTFYYGHRDSLQSLMPVPLPLILDQRSQAYVSCLKCNQGVGGLVMIDCDSCRKWYHIRCVGIDPSRIPIRWLCPECPNT